jgi:hypothetical protein
VRTHRSLPPLHNRYPADERGRGPGFALELVLVLVLVSGSAPGKPDRWEARGLALSLSLKNASSET